MSLPAAIVRLMQFVPRPAQRAAALACAVLVLAAPGGRAATNTPPAVWGKPATFAPRDVLYVFKPRATDADGDRLSFSIRNKPRWMWFDTRTGTLKGRPKWAQRGRTFRNIVIRVSDGRTTRALPAFAITVSAKSGLAGNAAPSISGSPSLRVTADKPYFFRPVAVDMNGDTLTYSILNKPAWAQFSTTTGTLRGTPTKADARTYGDITIRVSDGRSTTALRPFDLTVASAGTASRTVTLHWSMPTHNTDGTPLTDLAGYRVLYGTDSGRYSEVLSVPSPTIQAVELQNLAAGTWYFAIRSVNAAGIASDFSNEVRTTLP